jgi:small nuclear ribonucleoprotein (snRNP)-like protein
MLTMLQVYLNIVLDDALEERAGGEKVRIGMVVIRGNAVVMLEVRLPPPYVVLTTR